MDLALLLLPGGRMTTERVVVEKGDLYFRRARDGSLYVMSDGDDNPEACFTHELDALRWLATHWGVDLASLSTVEVQKEIREASSLRFLRRK